MDAVTDPVRPDTSIELGPLTATFIEGDLFDVRWRGVEVLQRLYLAVRDEAWNTIPARFSGFTVDRIGSTATIEFDATHESGAMSFTWHGTVRATSEGELSYEMRGRANRDFRYCKIGFNVHHGLESHAGCSFRCRTTDGEYSGVFGADIEPQLIRDGTLTAMTPHFDRLEVDLPGALVSLDFEGDRFEMQDHRNWTDANWKTYGTPLEYGFPMEIGAGTELYQRITMTVAGPGAGHGADDSVTLQVDSEAADRLPRIGHLLTAMPTSAQIERLRELHPAHVRVNLHPGNDIHGRLADAVDVARELDSHLEVALFIRAESVEDDAATMAEALVVCPARIARILVLLETSGFSALRGACPPEVADAVLAALSSRGVFGPSVLSGTTQFFADINRDRPDYSRLDGIVFAVNPQVHACDDRSMMQNARGIPPVVDFSRRLYGDIEVVLSPVDLIGVNGPFPGGPSGDPGRAANEDPRQRSSTGAAWTLAALSEMARCGVTSVTMFELVGPRGLMAEEDFKFPVAGLLAHLARLSSSTLVPVRNDGPERVAALAFEQGEAHTMLIGNLANAPTHVRLPDGGDLSLPPYGLAHWTEGQVEFVD